mgnify:CR=1 FL=1
MGAGNSTQAANEKEFTKELLKELKDIDKTDIPNLKTSIKNIQKIIDNVPKLITKLEGFENNLKQKDNIKKQDAPITSSQLDEKSQAGQSTGQSTGPTEVSPVRPTGLPTAVSTGKSEATTGTGGSVRFTRRRKLKGGRSKKFRSI